MSMLVCAAVGLALLVVGASTLTLPSTHVAAQTRPAAPVSAVPSTGSPASEAPASSAHTSAETPASPEPGVAEGSLDGVFVADRGPGTYASADVSVPTTADSGRLYRVDVRVEDSLGLDPDDVARTIARTLDDPRSWRSTGRARFSVVPMGQPADLHAYVVTPGTTDRLCYPLLTRGEVSCRAGDKVVLNAKRWVLGAEAYGTSTADVADYREYLVNHEFGHALGRSHVGCPGRDKPSPVMLQQTKGLQGCTANPWPSVTQG